MIPEPIAATLKVTNLLDQLNIPYILVGSFASAVHGIIRTTQDADILVDMKTENVPDFLLALQDEFIIDDQMVSREVQTRGSFNIIHKASLFKIDIFISKQGPFEQSRMSRAQTQFLTETQDSSVKVTSAEDILLAKLEWYRKGGEVSERQWRDVVGILRVQSENLDDAYLQRWASQLGIIDLLEKLLNESESPSNNM